MLRIFAPKKFYGVATCVLICKVLFFVPIAGAGTYIDKEHRDYFLSEELQKKFYRIEGLTYKFIERQHSSINGLVESFRGTSRYCYDLFTRAFCFGRWGSLDGQSFTYDGATAAIACALAGRTKKAESILSVYEKEFYWLKNDMVGLFNSYRTDVYDGTRLPIGVDGDRIHLGPSMWVGISALQYTALTGDTQFVDFIIDIAKWAQRLNHYRFQDGKKGAVSMGFGWGPDWSVVYSTENNLDYYAVLTMIKQLYESGNSQIRNIFYRKSYTLKDIDSELEGIKRWLEEVAYDSKKKTFNCGYNEKGIDRTRALDTITWSISALGTDLLKELGINPFSLIDFAERKFLVANDIEEQRIRGFDFTDTEGRQRQLRMVWVEGTAQQILAYQAISRYCNKMGYTEKSKEYRKKAIKYSDELEKVSQLTQLIDSSLPYTCKRLGEKEIVFAFKEEWEIPRGKYGKWVASLAGTVWRYFALSGFNPLKFDTEAVSYKLFQSRPQYTENR